ncbi:PA14 domain-containing protein [Leptolyngbya sp. AN03gr2]|uniref:PA14 domain-containing protein n=1 Tax=unclassified Leptolyngbya TaxID=2650499 RepID=UPI003D319332
MMNADALTTSTQSPLALATPLTPTPEELTKTRSSLLNATTLTPSGTGLKAEYFDNLDFTNQIATRTDSTVNFNWGAGSPHTIAPDTFSVRWSGQVQARFTETYTFYTIADDGVRLWVNDQLVIINWVNQAPTERRGAITLNAGQRYNIRLEYFENTGGAVARLGWFSARQAREIIPQSQLASSATSNLGTGLTGDYFDNSNFTNLITTRVDPTIDFNWGTGTPYVGVAPDTFSVRWSGQIQAPTTGTYTFATTSNDGIRLWINGQSIVDRWVDLNNVENRGTIALEAGKWYDIRMDYYDRTGAAMMRLEWWYPGQARQVVPQARLFNVSFRGTQLDDTIEGDANNNLIRGMGGNNVLRGNAGNDVLIGGSRNDTIDGGVGDDTVSYAEAGSGVAVDLAQGIASRMARILPLGDSITYGVSAYNPRTQTGTPITRGGYRGVLSDLATSNGITFDFVGSQTQASDALSDKEHEGHPGDTIDQIATKISRSQINLRTLQADVVLLMIGTNDTNSSDTPTVMRDQLSQLIDQITNASPDATVLVSTIAPILPEAATAWRDLGFSWSPQKAIDYNNLLPALIAAKVAQGRKVQLVDMRSKLTAAHITPLPTDAGVHPTLEGFNIMGQSWYDALNSSFGTVQGNFAVDRDQLISIENAIGSEFNDMLVGNDGVNGIDGGAGDDRIMGGKGNDVLAGGAGVDTFVYRDATEGGDLITDFTALDRFEISAAGFGLSLESMPQLIIDGLATLNTPTFLYNNGVLSLNNNGSETVIARLQGSPALDISQIRLV